MTAPRGGTGDRPGGTGGPRGGVPRGGGPRGGAGRQSGGSSRGNTSGGDQEGRGGRPSAGGRPERPRFGADRPQRPTRGYRGRPDGDVGEDRRAGAAGERRGP